jgi:hypothetical protein
MERHHQDRVKIYASAPFVPTVEANKAQLRRVDEFNPKKTVANIAGRALDYSWLKGASETYQISPNIEDYLITEVPIVTVGVPNRNLHSFPFEEVTYFDPRFGQFVYRTFVGKPAYANHENKDFVKAKGVHFDASLRKVPGWDIWKIYVLLGYDRSKDPTLANNIERGQRRGYSMGAWVSYFISSLTGQISNGNQPMKYPVGTVHDGRLSYSHCTGCEYFECISLESLVKTTSGPAAIKHLQEGDLVFGEFGDPIRVKRVFDNGLKPVADVVGEDGRVLATCTEEHRWLMSTGDVVKAKDFKPGDAIRQVTGQDRFTDVVVRYGGNRREEHTFDIHVDSASNLYQLDNGLVTHNTSSVEGPADVSAESNQLWFF